MTESPLFRIFVYLSAAVVAVPLSKRLGLGSVLGYLLAGVLIGPHLLGWAGNVEDAHRFAEFGVIMMLFLIGLELQPRLLWSLRVPILGLGTLQVVLTAAVAAGAALALGIGPRAAAAVGLALAMSSTAIVLPSLQEKGLDRTSGGRSVFSVLLFQDMAVIPVLALLPLLADRAAPAAGHGNGLAALHPAVQAAAVLASVAAVIAAGRFLARPAFRYIAGTRMREVFTAFALLLVIGITLLMEAVGLSPALGAFLAGVVLADSEYRHELESDIEPFKGLLLGLFFISVGAGLDLPYLAARPALLAALTAGIMLLKSAVLGGLGRAFRLEPAQRAVFAASLCQVGEFAFVLIGLGQGMGILPAAIAKSLAAATALSMAATPPLLILLRKAVLPRLAAAPESPREMDAIPDEGAEAIIAGFGRMGNVLGRLLLVNGIRTTVLEHNPETVEQVRKLGLKAYYGDASRLDLLASAGAEKAKVMILAIDDPGKTLEIAEAVRRHFPHLKLLCRARAREDGYALVNMGVDHVFRETFGTSMDAGFEALRLLGMGGHRAHRAVQAFRAHNEAAFLELAAHWSDRKTFWEKLRGKIREADALLKADGRINTEVDAAWDNSGLRAGSAAPAADGAAAPLATASDGADGIPRPGAA